MFLDFYSEFYSWIRGGLFVLFLYHFIIFFQNRSKLYLYYSLYLLGLTIYLTKHVAPDSFVNFYNYVNYPIQFLACAAYVAFARELLETRQHLIKLDKIFEFEIKILLLLAPIFVLIQAFLGHNYQVKLFIVIAPLISLFTLFVFYIILKKLKDKFSLFFIIGSLIYVLFAIVSFSEIYIGTNLFSSKEVQPMLFVYLGSLLQSIIFSIIIGFTIKRIEEKSKNAEIKLALKLKEMEELKMTTLQSQMNPHFIFNSLNSINNFVLKSEVEKASDYITKFSKLIRVILNSSSSQTSTLSEELTILGLYVKLEQMRVNGGFEYIVNIDDNIELEKIEVPPLFLQPFIENSIWHGIMKVEGEKIIKLSIEKNKNIISCIIEDNGIGIDKAKENSSHISERKKFFGAQATVNRIEMLYQKKDVNIVTEDLSSIGKKGTRLTVSFPFSKNR